MLPPLIVEHIRGFEMSGALWASGDLFALERTLDLNRDTLFAYNGLDDL